MDYFSNAGRAISIAIVAQRGLLFSVCAGFTVMRILDEPTAAAIAYGFQSREDIHHVIVYDFGGGTLDVSLLYISEGSVQVIGTSGDDHLGGSDFDAVFASYLFDRVHRELEQQDVAGGSTTPVTSDGFTAMRRDVSTVDGSCSLPSLRIKAEAAKCKLSEIDRVEIACKHSMYGSTVTMSVTRDEFETATASLFERALVPIHAVLEVSPAYEPGLAEACHAVCWSSQRRKTNNVWTVTALRCLSLSQP